MLTRPQALDEARKQKEALAVIGGWRRRLFAITASLFAVCVFGFTTEGWMVLGIVGAAGAAVGFLLTCVVDLSIRNGRRNVEKILDSLKS